MTFTTRCLEEQTATLVTVPTVPTATTGYPNPAAWAWLIILLMVVGFETWAIFTHHLTLSQWIQRQSVKHRWLKWLGVGLLSTLIWHLFFE